VKKQNKQAKEVLWFFMVLALSGKFRWMHQVSFYQRKFNFLLSHYVNEMLQTSK